MKGANAPKLKLAAETFHVHSFVVLFIYLFIFLMWCF